MEDVLLIYFEQILILCIEIQTHSRYFVKTHSNSSLNSAIYTDRVISRSNSWKFYTSAPRDAHLRLSTWDLGWDLILGQKS